jgi:hypothetical protein
MRSSVHARLIEVGGIEVPLLLFLKDRFQEGVEYGCGVIVLILDPAPSHFHPEFAGFRFILVEGAILCCDDSLLSQFRRFHAEHLADPLYEGVKRFLAEQGVAFIAAGSMVR